MLNFKPSKRFKCLHDIVSIIDIPILILDTVWLSFFPKRYKNDKIKSLECDIKNFMKEEAKLRERKKVIELMKKKDISKIVELTNEVYEKENEIAKIDMKIRHDAILKANDEYKKIDKKIEELRENLNKANQDLLEETINICYNLMRESRDKLDLLIPDIESLREELKNKVSEKAVLEEDHEKTYNLLFRLVGRDVIENLDKEYNNNLEKHR